jgi:hypothetical protein
VVFGWRAFYSFNHTNLCSSGCWPKCEHIEGSTDFSFPTQFLQFVSISSNKISTH